MELNPALHLTRSSVVDLLSISGAGRIIDDIRWIPTRDLMNMIQKSAVILLALLASAAGAQPSDAAPGPGWGPSWVGGGPPGGFPRPKKVATGQTVVHIGEEAAPIGVGIQLWGDTEVQKGTQYLLGYQIRVHNKKGELGPLLSNTEKPPRMFHIVAKGTVDNSWNGLEGQADITRSDLSNMKNLPVKTDGWVTLRVEPQLYDEAADKFVTPSKPNAVILRALVGKTGRVQKVVSLRSWVKEHVVTHPDMVLDMLADLDACEADENGFGEAVGAILAAKKVPTATKVRAIRLLPISELRSKSNFGLMNDIQKLADDKDADLKAAAVEKLKELKEKK